MINAKHVKVEDLSLNMVNEKLWKRCNGFSRIETHEVNRQL